VVSYNLYYGGASQTYTNMVEAGDATNAIVSGLLPGAEYFFAVTAVDDVGLASVFSNEISYQVPLWPVSWQTAGIGSVGVAGNASASNNICTVSGAGNLSGLDDNFSFVYQPLDGDGEITACLASLASAGTNGCAGVMIRESLTSGSEYAFMGFSASGTFLWQSRSRTLNQTSSTTSTAGTPPNVWMRLARTGDVLYGYQSTDGTNWTEVTSQTITMATQVYLGLAVASGSSTNLTTAMFTNINVVDLPAPWRTTGIGSVGMAGNASVSNNIYTVSSAGNLGGLADNFNFVYQPLDGEGEITACLASLASASTNGCAGVMIRESLTSGSEYAFMGFSASGTFLWQCRSRSLNQSSSTTSTTGTPPNVWMRLARTGNVLYGYQSTDGTNWTEVNSQDITMAKQIYVGLAVASGSSTTLTTVTFTNISVAELPAPGETADIGRVGVAARADFGLRTNQFGFIINAANGMTVAVDACTNLANPSWMPLATNTLTGSSLYFSDPQWTNYPSRFYRLRWP
jgi:regulation of enolase protein 1 (concanavalin A-like superfamily)